MQVGFALRPIWIHIDTLAADRSKSYVLEAVFYCMHEESIAPVNTMHSTDVRTFVEYDCVGTCG